MRTDLVLNYAGLQALSEQMGAYYSVIEEVEEELENLKEILEEQKSEAVSEVLGDISAIAYASSDKRNILKQLKELLDDYIMDMKELISPISDSKNVRADQLDVCYNVGEMAIPILEFNDAVNIACWGKNYTVSLGETPQEKQKRENAESNYRTIESFRKTTLMDLAGKLGGNLEKIYNIYHNNVKPFEQTDDDYRKRINKLYSACTDTVDKYFDTREFLNKVSWSFLEPLMGIWVFAIVFVIAPEVGVAMLVVSLVGCVTLTCVPKQYVPRWWQDEKETVDTIVSAIKGGKLAVIEAIGQGLMDTVQTPEGIAAISGTVVGLATTGKMLKTFDPQIKVAKGKYNLWKQGLKSDYGESIVISEQKMYQQGRHYNKHGRTMGYSGKKEYEQAARDFFKQNKNTAEIYEGVWNSSRGGQSGQKQIIIRKDGKQLIINKDSGQIIDFYEGTSLDGFIDIERVQ